jgi:hypothetical protein
LPPQTGEEIFWRLQITLPVIQVKAGNTDLLAGFEPGLKMVYDN